MTATLRGRSLFNEMSAEEIEFAEERARYRRSTAHELGHAIVAVSYGLPCYASFSASVTENNLNACEPLVACAVLVAGTLAEDAWERSFECFRKMPFREFKDFLSNELDLEELERRDCDERTYEQARDCALTYIETPAAKEVFQHFDRIIGLNRHDWPQFVTDKELCRLLGFEAKA